MSAHLIYLKFMERDSRRTLVWVVLAIVVVTIAIPLYFYFDPAHSYLAPKCLFHFLTGLDCPSCGNQRALHALLNGEVWLSFRYNPFMWLCAPYFLLVIISALIKTPRMQRLFGLLSSNKVIITFLVFYCLWWVVRNLPFWHNLVDLPR